MKFEEFVKQVKELARRKGVDNFIVASFVDQKSRYECIDVSPFVMLDVGRELINKSVDILLEAADRDLEEEQEHNEVH